MFKLLAGALILTSLPLLTGCVIQRAEIPPSVTHLELHFNGSAWKSISGAGEAYLEATTSPRTEANIPLASPSTISIQPNP